MDGPRAYIEEHRAEVRRRLAARDLAPEVHYGSAEKIPVPDQSVHLVVTSPPYPMIEVWDQQFADGIGIPAEDPAFFQRAHDLLGRVWAECRRALAPGGILCVNVGDATRTVDGAFQCFQNHVEVARRLDALGFLPLVPILWKKPTNKPNAFLGSGFIPPNGYVTLDCEHILVYRKGPPRKLPAKDPLRYASAFSKAERDQWFSQIWEIRGARQAGVRDQGVAPFPEEVPYRLVRMFSLIGETVLDPFAGTGATLETARRLGRKAVGVELNRDLAKHLDPIVRAGAPNPDRVLQDLLARYASHENVP